MKSNQPSIAVDSRGFTLIELMIALFIGLFLVAGVITLVDFSTRSYRAQERVADIQQDARAALEIMTRDIRMAGFSPTRFLPDASEPPSFITANGNTLRIVADLDLNETIDVGTQEDITYTVSDHVLTRTTQTATGSITTPLIGNVDRMDISYLDNEGNPVAAGGENTSAVRIDLRCYGRDASGGEFQRNLSTTVAVRNLVLRPEGAV